MFGWESGWRLKSLLDHLWLREEFGLQKKSVVLEKRKCDLEKKKWEGKDKGVRQQFVRSPSCPLQPAFADDTYTASADDTTLLTSFTPPSHSYKLFLTLHKMSTETCAECWQNKIQAVYKTSNGPKKEKWYEESRKYETIRRWFSSWRHVKCLLWSSYHTTIRPHLVLTSKPWN